MQKLYDYIVSFETDGNKRIKVHHTEYNIHSVIKKVRVDYPDARMFIVVSKKELSTSIK